LVLRNGKAVRKPSTRLNAGDVLEATWEPETIASDLTPVEGALEILFEDGDLLVLNKAPGVVVHPASAHRGVTLVHHVLFHLKSSTEFLQTSETRPGIVHRLDVGTSGVIVFAKRRSAQEFLSRQFKDRTVEKEYEAWVWGEPPRVGQFQSPIGRDRVYRTRMSSRTDAPRPALTRFERGIAFRVCSHMRLFPKTGRTHQLRVHLSEAGFPILNDPTYGKGRHRFPLPEPANQLLVENPHTFLHARRLRLTHPDGRILEWKAEPPSHFSKLLQILSDAASDTIRD
jgi:23S rRNA pseudouridine1911/1915/1917 synthase